MFRRRSVGKARMEPEVCILLRNIARYPGDVMQGVVIVDLAVPVDILTLELRLAGDERATIGGFLITDKNPEARKTLYYEQFVTLRGVDRDALEQRRGLLGRRRTVVSQDTLMRQSASNAASLSNQGGASSSDAPSGNNSIADLSPSVASGSAAGSVHLVPGTYSFPFKVTLPDALPPSRELYRAREGIVTLRYHATATMILVGGKVHSAEAPFAVNPLPVQMQRWFQLHGDEQNGMEASEAEDGVAADLGSSAVEGASSRVGFKSRLMSSPGTISADAADKEREVMCQRRIRHYRQFPEQQLAVERAEYERRAAAEGGEDAEGGAGNGRGRDSPSSPLQRNETAITTGTAAAAAAGESESSPRTRPRTYRERRAQQDAADNRSLDGAGDQDKAFASAEPEEGQEEDAVRAFGGEQSGTETPTPPPTADGDPLSGGDTGNGAVEAKRKKKHRHHGKAAAEGSALVENAVDQLAFTPPEEDLAPAPAHLRVRHSTDATAASAQQPSRRKSRDAKASKKGGNDNDTNSGGEEGREKSLSTQAHKRRSRFVPPPWHQEFSINLRGGFLRSGKVKVKLSLRSPLVSIGYGNVAVKLLVDNSDGGGTITKLKYSLVTRCYIRTKTEVYNYHVDSVETITDVNIEKGTVVVVPEVEVPVPKSTPLTMLTEGMGTLTFLNVRFYVGTALKTFSKSVETEVVMVSGQDSQNNSRRLLRWTCFYRRRSNEDTRELTLRPPTVNLSEQNAKVCVVKASELARPAGSPMAGGGEADTSSMAPSVMSRSQQLMRHSRRIAKDAPSIDNRRLASVLKYDTAIFVPPADDDDAAMPPSHVDPMSMLNPFAMPPPNMVSSLPSPERNDKEL